MLNSINHISTIILDNGVEALQIYEHGGVVIFKDKEEIKAINSILNFYKEDQKTAYGILKYILVDENDNILNYKDYLY